MKKQTEADLYYKAVYDATLYSFNLMFFQTRSYYEDLLEAIENGTKEALINKINKE